MARNILLKKRDKL